MALNATRFRNLVLNATRRNVFAHFRNNNGNIIGHNGTATQ
jgi:hypothetical protein